MADHFRVQNSIIRDHFVIDDSFFYAFLWNGNDRVAGGLRAGPAGGRQKHCFDLLMGQRGITQKVLYGIRSIFQYGAELCCVHYAATADGDDHVTLQVFNGLDYVLNIQIAGLPLNIRVQVIRSTVQLLQYAGA